MTWIGAAAYAAWAGARLPTFAELNTATLASSPTNTFYAVGDTVAVTEPGRGPGEAHHLVGNVQVWCDDGPATELLHCLSAVPIDTSSQGHGRYGLDGSPAWQPTSTTATSRTPRAGSSCKLRHLDASIRWHYDVHVRTTLTLDPDVAQLVDEAAHRARTSMKQVINDALRRALSQPPSRREPYHLPVHEATLQPGFDLAGFNRLADELEDEAILATGKRPGS